ncbi:39S ribosomal protein L18-like [Homarus americanus]|uniref:Large ribosomal subunit protein uL18m n=1 Tax=Homarus americanus TaxID=6706 RepID=A0A8J5K3P3_HOMAM|nr:39S ribosomal protein L18-like [Homarus americanus]
MSIVRPLLPVLARSLGSCSGLPLARNAHNRTCDENDSVNPNFVNRNPRNMEMLRLARKPQGWHLEASTPKYWLVLEQSQRHITGQVVHYTGTTVVSASTREWAIKQQLYSTTDVIAIENIGRILAQRCLESGITEVYTDLEKSKESSEKVRLFLSALTVGGICPKEASVISERDVHRTTWSHPALPWHVTEDEVLKEDQMKNAQ